MPSSKDSEDCPINYQPNSCYSLETFIEFNEWLNAHEFVIDGNPISHFERNPDGTLLPVTQAPIEKEAAAAEILIQLGIWNINFKQHGTCTSSQGGFKFGAGTIRAPDVAFTPRDAYCALDDRQRRTFQGAAFCPTFVVEVDDISSSSTLNMLTNKFKDTYFPAGVKLGWLIDPINKTIYTFTEVSDGVVRRRPHQWYGDDGKPGVLKGGSVLPEFVLKLEKIDQALSQVRSYFFYQFNSI
jgi:Uma2 family endonuclease